MRIKQLMETSAHELPDTKNFLSKITYDFYRGSKEEIEDYKLVQQREKDRKPLDTLYIAHKIMNQKTKEKFGINIRNLSFITMDKGFAENYGEPYRVVPKGEFRLFCVENVDDIVDHYDIDGYRIGRIVIDELKNMKFIDERIHALNHLTSVRAKMIKSNELLRNSDNVRDISKWIMNLNDFEKIKDNPDAEITTEIADKLADKVMTDLYNEVDRYVSDIKEVTSNSDITSDMTYSEFMLYAPKGIYLINTDNE